MATLKTEEDYAAQEKANLKRELNLSTQNAANKKSKQSLPASVFGQFVDRSMTNEEIQKSNELLCDAFISGNIPWSFADNPEFQKYVSFVRPTAKLPCRQHL